MAKSHINKEQFWKLMASHMLLIILCTVAITALMPHTGVIQFDYELNHPWAYNQLIAETETPIYKSEEVLKHERDSMLKNFEPYFNLSTSVAKNAISNFEKNYGNGIPGVPAGYTRYIAKRLQVAYEKGIISTEEAQRAVKDTTVHIRLVTGNTATSVPMRQFMTPIAAYEWLFSDPVMQKQRQALQHCNLNEYLEPNIIYDTNRTQSERDDILGGIAVASGMIQVGEKIIDRGEVVDEGAYTAISAYLKEMQQRTTTRTELFTTYGGQAMYIFILITVFTMYLALYRSDYFEKKRSIAMLYLLITFLPILVALVMKHHFFTVYVLPLCMAPMFVRVFMDSRTAFITHAIVVLISAMAVQNKFDFVAIELIGGLAAIYTLRELSRRSQIFIAAITISTSELLMYISLQLIQMTNIGEFNWSISYHFIANAVLLLLAYPMMFLVEKTFGFVSAVTLFELSDTNKDLLRRLSEVAPATMQHSITVGNLAAEIASRIGARALLVRTGAMYHDIGKMRHPVFFTENQAGINPHNRISETESAQVLISHVTEGLRIAEKADLPSVIQDFIRTHHGAGLVRYFYIQYKNNHPDEEINESLFRYPGPNPFTREQAILMMADTVEAASHSLSEYTEESISALVNRLIDTQMQEGYFHECPITYRDITIAKEVLIERLKAIYHTRVAYPELNKTKKVNDEPETKKKLKKKR